MRDELLVRIPNTVINGSRSARVANNVNISIPGIDSEFAVITLDTHGIAASTKSACGTSNSEGSHVVRTISLDDARATTTIRFTFGETTTKNELIRAIEVLQKHVETVRLFKQTLPQ